EVHGGDLRTFDTYRTSLHNHHNPLSSSANSNLLEAPSPQELVLQYDFHRPLQAPQLSHTQLA
ncbi:hypothetical protein L195_g064059, partial [Trifolium pratense]